MTCKREVLGWIVGVQEVISFLSGETDANPANAMEEDTGELEEISFFKLDMCRILCTVHTSDAICLF